MVEFDFDQAFSGVFRESYGRITAALAREFRDLELAEDALQEALVVAARQWSQAGLPENAAGWLYIVARRKAIDALRREARRTKKDLAAAQDIPSPESGMAAMYGVTGLNDQRLSLIFACCHPVINEPAQVALTLHTLSALGTAEIASAFLVRETTVAQRIVRAKRKIKEAGIPFFVPDIENAPERLGSVLSVVYLIFNAGYTAHSGGTLLKTDLCDEALFLSRMLAQLIPGNSEVQGLLALLLIQDSRRQARVADDGSLVLLQDQDRSRWDLHQIEEALVLLATARALSDRGYYQTQAEIAAVHARSLHAEDTNWAEIVNHYDLLLGIHPSAVVKLNRAVAVSRAMGPEEGLRSLEELALSGELDEYRYYHSTRAEFLIELDRHQEATESFQRALHLTQNEQERFHLLRRMEAARKNSV